VLIDGEPVKSCNREVSTLAEDRHHRRGIGTHERPHPLQQAFLDEQAGQCGYCLAGILISAKALLEKNPSPTRKEIALALDDNICRCGSHNRIYARGRKSRGRHAGDTRMIRKSGNRFSDQIMRKEAWNERSVLRRC